MVFWHMAAIAKTRPTTLVIQSRAGHGANS
jgi:hypothetical protein